MSSTTRRGRPRIGTLFKKWRGRYLAARSKLAHDLTEHPWYLRWMVEGKRHTICTGLCDYEEALRERSKFMGPLKYGRGARILEAYVELGRAAARQLSAERNANPGSRLPLVWETYLASRHRPNSGPGTLNMYRLLWRRFCAWLPPTLTYYHEVTPAMAEEYCRQLEVSKLKSRTVKGHVQALRLIFRVVCPDVPQNPWAGIRTTLHSDSTPYRRLTDPEIGRLLAHCGGELRTLFLLAVHTGMRRADCCTLSWDRVDLGNRVLTVHPRKTRRRIPQATYIPIVPRLCRTLATTPEVRRSGYVLPGIAQRYLSNVRALFRDIDAVFETAHVRDTAEGRASFHALRTTYVSKLCESGLPLAVVMKLVSHTNITMTDLYNRMEVLSHRDQLEKALTFDGISRPSNPGSVRRDGGRSVSPSGADRPPRSG